MKETTKVGLIAAILGACLGAGAVWGFTYSRLAGLDQRMEGWRLVPVVVFNRDVPAGTALDYDQVAKMQMPEQFATASMVKPIDFDKVIGRKLVMSVQRGDLVFWSQFQSAARDPAIEKPD